MALPVPESSFRNRSVSVGDSELPQHESKRPRLSEVDPETPSRSSAETQSVTDERTDPKVNSNAPSLQTPPESPLPFSSPTKVMSPTSKVTINTRPLSSQSLHSAEPISTETLSTLRPEESSAHDSVSELPAKVNVSHGGSSKPESGHAAAPISISSSPNASPSIEVQVSAESDGTTVESYLESLSDLTALESESISQGHIRATFPYNEKMASSTPKIISDMAQHLEMGGSEDANIISRLTIWFNEFVTGSRELSYMAVEEDYEVWQQIPRLIAGLLKRMNDLRDSVQEADLVDFFTAYTRLTIRMTRFDLQRFYGYPERVDSTAIKAPHFFEYMRQLTGLLRPAGLPAFFKSLQSSRRIEPETLIEKTTNDISQDEWIELINILAGYLKHLMRLVAVNHRLLGFVSNLIQHSSPVLQAFGTYPALRNEVDHKVQRALSSYFSYANASLEQAIKKQQPWLSIDTSQPVIANFLTLTNSMLYCVPSLAQMVVHAAGVNPESYGEAQLFEFASYAYKFYVLLKYIKYGRMELRVYGIETMAACLVEIWTRLQQLQNPLEAPLLHLTVAFLQSNDIVRYILGVGSHPQIVQRSCNVIGFLCISSNWQPSDTDVAFHAILDSQDARSAAAVLDVLKGNVQHLDASSLQSICSELMSLPFEKYDSKLFSFTLVVLQIGAQKFAPIKANEPSLHLSIVNLCLRLLREATSPAFCGNELPNQLRFEIHRFLMNDHRKCYRNILEVMSPDDRSTTLGTLCRDIAEHNDFATGSVLAMDLLVQTLDPNDSITFVRDCEYTCLLVEDIARSPQFSENSDTSHLERSLWTFWEIRFSALATLIMGMPDTFDQSLLKTLWSVISSPETVPVARLLAWNTLATAFQQSTFHNHVLDSLVTEFFPTLSSSAFDQAALFFATQSVEYEMRLSPSELIDPSAAIEIPGMERIWRIMLEAKSNTIEADATDFIIQQYLDSDTMTRRTAQSIDATHSVLIDRCVRTVIESAERLKSISDIETHDSSHGYELRFNRSLLFLRKFLTGIKSRPRYRAMTTNKIQPLLDAFVPKGAPVDLTLMIISHPTISGASHSLTVGEENTGTELFQFLVEVTGWPQINFIKGGVRFTLQAQSTPLSEIRFGPGPVMLSKAYGVQEDTPARSVRATSPVDDKVMHHFEDLYNLLDSNDELAREIYEFLTLFSSQESIVQNISSMSLSPEELLPVDHPFRLLYYIRALRSCIEDESFNSIPKIEFIQYAIRSIVSSLPRFEEIRTDYTIKIAISHGIAETLLLALRAKVSPETSLSYFDDHASFTKQILKLWNLAYEAVESDTTQPTAPVLVCIPFETLIEASLHDVRLWKFIHSDSTFTSLLGRGISQNKNFEVRKAFLDVICRLVGTSSNKIPKQNDDRSPRARFSSDRVDSALKSLWLAIKVLIPEACANQSLCQQVFEVAWLSLKAVGNKLDQHDLYELFEQLRVALLDHAYEQDIGQEPKDHATWGLAKVLHQSWLFMSAQTRVSISGEALIGEIFSRLLFPPLSNQDRVPTETEAIPVLDSNTREALYDLIIALCSEKDCLSKTVTELAYGDLIDASAFLITSSNDRKALRSSVGYSGLRNLSNTCYLNSLFTQLFMNLKLREFILGVSIVDETKQKLVSELAAVFASMQGSYEKYVSPEDAVDAITQYDGEQIDVTVQMDVDEFFNLLFDRLEAQMIDPDSRNVFKSMYGGQLVQQIKSKECEHVSERLEPFSAVQIEIRGKAGLEEGLQAYVEGEVLQGDNKYSCTACGRHVDAVKRACLKDIPDNLIFNLKRFDYDIMTGIRCKINDEFEFPETVDMAPYTIAALTNPNEAIQPDNFELVGVIIHSGTAETGHYYSYVRQRPSATDKNNSWVHFNDQDVTKFDPELLKECAFGGVDTSFNNMPKFYNGYMLFYQRSASIQRYEQEFPAVDPINPVAISLPDALSRQIALQNELCLRTFVVQDPVHAKFVRQLTESLPAGTEKCSSDHEVETNILHVSLEYLQLVSSRWRDAPELEDVVKMLITQAGRCEVCAVDIVQWFASGDNVIVNIIRTFFTAARRAFATLLCGALSGICAAKLKWSSDIAQSNTASNIATANAAITDCIGKLSRGWDLLQRHNRSWDSYFGVLSHTLSLGDEEAGIVVEAGFLEKSLELIWLHGPGPQVYSRDLRQKYHFYLTGREKNKVFGHTHLLEFFTSLIQHVDLDEHSTKPESFNSTTRLPANEEEVNLLCLAVQNRKPSWLSKIILGRNSPEAAIEIVKELCNYQDRLPMLAKILLEGLEDANSIANAVSFLDPTIAFFEHCPDEHESLELAKEALESIETTDGHYAYEFLNFVKSLVLLSNDESENNLQKIVVDKIVNWGPVLVMAPNDVQHDVRADTLELMNSILFSHLSDLRLQSPQNYQKAVQLIRKLSKACLSYIRKTFSNPQPRERRMLQAGQASHVDTLLKTCKTYFSTDNADDEALIEAIESVTDDLIGLVRNTSEALEDWREPSSDLEQISDLESLEFSS